MKGKDEGGGKEERRRKCEGSFDTVFSQEFLR